MKAYFECFTGECTLVTALTGPRTGPLSTLGTTPVGPWKKRLQMLPFPGRSRRPSRRTVEKSWTMLDWLLAMAASHSAVTATIAVVTGTVSTRRVRSVRRT